MSGIRSLLSGDHGRVYVYLADEEIGRRFLRDAQAEGFTFGDGVKPTQRHPSDLIAVNGDMTISYVGFVGRMAYHAAGSMGGRPIRKIDYRDIIG